MSKKQTILAICAHPDDAEIFSGGTLALLAERGWDVHIATVCAGDCGSAEESSGVIAVRRRAEAHAAAAYIGGTYHCLECQDVQVHDDNVMRGAATALLRTVNPDCVVTHYPIDYMPDHDAASAIARCSVFTAPMANFVVGPSAALPPTKGVIPLYYFCPLGGTDYFGNPIVPHFYVDTSSIMGKKAEMLSRHESQREWLRRQHGIDQYIEEMKEWDAKAGAVIGVTYAEKFLIHKGHAYPQTPLIQDALKDLIHEA